MTASGPIVRSEVNETLRPIVPEAKIGRLQGRGGDARPVYLARGQHLADAGRGVAGCAML